MSKHHTKARVRNKRTCKHCGVELTMCGVEDCWVSTKTGYHWCNYSTAAVTLAGLKLHSPRHK